LSQIIVDLITPDGMKLEKTAVPEEYTVRQIIMELVDQLGLPAFENGATVEYSLTWVNQGSRLGLQQTLAEAGVCTGDQLQLNAPSAAPQPAPAAPPPFPTTSGQNVEVVLTLLDMNKSVRETFDSNKPVQDILIEIARKHQLPSAGQLSPAIDYSLRSKALGRVLTGTETLGSAGVPGNDGLVVLRVETAG
jgi:uncharacterized ubiquitin-like protein YukD